MVINVFAVYPFMGIMAEEGIELIRRKAKQINDQIYGRTRKKKTPLDKALKMQVNESARFALGEALKKTELPRDGKKGFVELLREQPDAINLLLVKEGAEKKSIEMLSPLLGEKTSEFIHNFRVSFNALQKEIAFDRQNFSAS
ncbi:MAG: hypothetical protein NUV67_01410 [archaeon]|nr:hypothetical protein [archaeon]